ncbi:MAG: endolytic transglycosylase MltG [Pseudomonadota bacterium]
MKKFFLLILVCLLLTIAAALVWRGQPIISATSAPIDFSVVPGSSVRSSIAQLVSAGVPVQPILLEALARFSGQSSRMKAGQYRLKPGTTPVQLLDQLVRGEFAQEALIVIEGWTFADMRRAVAAHPGLKHETLQLSESELLAKIAPELKAGEGLFFPDTYRFATNASDLHVYRQAYAMMQKKLIQHWQQRAPDLPYRNAYEALVMASIVEKETGQESERRQIAGVFVNRLRRGMLLQTDPTVIYGMGEQFKGNIRKKDLTTDTPYNTYTRTGLPPTPISLPGERSLRAALDPQKTEALYFVSRGDGTSQFSDNLSDHNRAVSKFQR